jgi:hypothetical protein
VVEEVFGSETYWDPIISIPARQELSPFSFTLEQNYPNPVSISTKIDFVIRQHAHIELSVYNSMGCKIIELINQDMDPGFYSTHLDAGHLVNGAYFYVLKADYFMDTRKFVVLKIH